MFLLFKSYTLTLATFPGNQMRGGNQGGPSPWQQGSGPQQHQQQQQPFHPQQQQQRQYQQPQMMQPQQRQPQQPGNWSGNPAWGNQGGQGTNCIMKF